MRILNTCLRIFNSSKTFNVTKSIEKILIPFHSLIYEYESKSRIYGKDVLISDDKGGMIAYKCSAGYAGIRTGGVHFNPNSRAHYGDI